MKHRRWIVLPLILALLAGLMTAAQAEGPEGPRGMEDYTKVRWFAESEGQVFSLNSMAGFDSRLEVDALPGSTWQLRAEYVRIRDGRRLPYAGELDVSQYAQWESDALSWDGGAVTLPEAEGVYALTGRFIDADGALFTCEVAFDVSADHVPTPTDQSFAADQAATVEEKVQQIAQSCRAQGFDNEYDIALYLHDWLIYHANYDYTYTEYEADGVLLKGTGVCDSYSKAYCLLLDQFGIENRRIPAPEMDHAWNLVKLDGQWCHIDVTWDDPGVGGDENQVYFGMSDALIARDHQWSGSYPAANSLDNYYPLRENLPCFADAQALDAILSESARAQVTPVTLVYIGADPAQTVADAVLEWIGENDAQYGLAGYGIGGTQFMATVSLSYTEPWVEPDNHLETPVDAPAFDLDSPRGRYQLKDYAGSGVVLVYGQTTCGNTRALLGSLSGRLDALYGRGVDVLVSMMDVADAAGLKGIEADYPGFHYAYAGDTLWSSLDAVGYPTEIGVTYPGVFVIDGAGKITYYSTGYVANTKALADEALAVGTGKPLPEPVKHADLDGMLNGTGNVNDITDGAAVVAALKNAAANGHALLVMDDAVYSADAGLMAYYEDHYTLFKRLGVTLVGAFYSVTDEQRQAYPHCAFIDCTDDDFWALQFAIGYSGGRVSYRTGILIERGGGIVAYTSGSLLSGGDCALYLARKLEYETTIPAGLTTIDAEAFSGTAFKRVDLTNGSLREVAAGAFANCKNLEFIRVPETVTAIGNAAFGTPATVGLGQVGSAQLGGGPVIICTVGSAAFEYAVENGMEYICE